MGSLTIVQILQIISALTQTVQELLAQYRPDEPIELSTIGNRHAEAAKMLEAYLAQQPREA